MKGGRGLNNLFSTKMVLLESGGEMSMLFDLNMQLVVDAVLMIIAIFFLFLAASYLLFNPVRKMLSDRQNKIKNELETTKSDMEAANELRTQYEAKIKDINMEAESILGEARKKALANENIIIAEAKQEAGRILANAQKEAELEKQKVADVVKKEMIAIASVMAGKIVTASIDSTIQESLIDETLKEMGEGTWLS